MILSIKDHFIREVEPIKGFQLKIQEVKACTENLVGTNDKWEDWSLELEDNDVFKEQLFKDSLKTILNWVEHIISLAN